MSMRLSKEVSPKNRQNRLCCFVLRRGALAASRPSSPREAKVKEGGPKQSREIHAEHRFSSASTAPGPAATPQGSGWLEEAAPKAEPRADERASLASRFCQGFSAACSSGRKGCRRRNLSTTCAPIRSRAGQGGGGCACGTVPLPADKRLLFVFLLKVLSRLPLLGDPLVKPLGGLTNNKSSKTPHKHTLCHCSALPPLGLGGGASLAPPSFQLNVSLSALSSDALTAGPSGSSSLGVKNTRTKG